MLTVVLISVLFLAFVNGGNDNFKGVATIYGSGTASYRTSLAWATVATAAGSLLAPIIAPGLIGMFTAKGLAPDAVAGSPAFMSSAVLAAAATIAIATRTGMPISTTHALTGGLFGAGMIGAGSDLNLRVLGQGFVLPLFAGPFVAAALASIAAAMLGRRHAGSAPARPAARSLESVVHFLSAGAVSFARGINDTPKIVALGLAANILGGGRFLPVAAVAAIMALGGVVMSRRVAETMSTKVTALDPSTGVIANITSAALVITASICKLPLSTTHVTTGAIVGVGAIRGRVEWGMFGKIATAWVTTLPVAAVLGAVLYLVLSRL